MTQPGHASSNVHFAKGLARAFAGSVIFGLPLLMTMEMWWFGFSMEPWRQVLFLLLFFPFLVLLSWHAGFEQTFSWRDDVLDALVALAVGFVSAIVVLALLGILERDMPLRSAVGIVVLQAVPASIGGLLAQSMLGERPPVEGRGPGPRYASELFIMGVGALFLAFNLAPTDEILLLAVHTTELQILLLIALSLAVMHAFVYSVEFRAREPGTRAEGTTAAGLFLRFTIAGYALALLLSAYILWSFGRLDGVSTAMAIKSVAVLGFPAAVGASAARLIL